MLIPAVLMPLPSNAASHHQQLGIGPIVHQLHPLVSLIRADFFANTGGYAKWCNIAKLKYMRITAEITNSEPDENFRLANIKLNQCELKIIEKALAH